MPAETRRSSQHAAGAAGRGRQGMRFRSCLQWGRAQQKKTGTGQRGMARRCVHRTLHAFSCNVCAPVRLSRAEAVLAACASTLAPQPGCLNPDASTRVSQPGRLSLGASAWVFAPRRLPNPLPKDLRTLELFAGCGGMHIAGVPRAAQSRFTVRGRGSGLRLGVAARGCGSGLRLGVAARGCGSRPAWDPKRPLF